MTGHVSYAGRLFELTDFEFELLRHFLAHPAELLGREHLVEDVLDRLNVLIGKLLTLSLMESMRQAPSAETFSLGEILETLLPNMKFEAEAHGARVVYKSECDGLMLHGHPEMLRRVLENIIRNSICYTAPGESVEIFAVLAGSRRDKETEAEACEILIADRGPGVPEETLTELFRPFYRVDMAREGTTGGFGVGLAIAERAVQLHRGSIIARNRHEGGLKVTVCLPLSDPEN